MAETPQFTDREELWQCGESDGAPGFYQNFTIGAANETQPSRTLPETKRSFENFHRTFRRFTAEQSRSRSDCERRRMKQYFGGGEDCDRGGDRGLDGEPVGNEVLR